MYRINVLIVTYKQADVIGRNIESILQQKEYGLNKIVICDDCSPDNNWEVIQSYINKYPEYIDAYHNETNLGIYGNSNKLASLCGEADLYCWLEGDDALCPGFFQSMQKYIVDHNIDLSQPVGIFGDYYAINTKGERTLVHNNYIEKVNAYGAYLRNLATWRASLFSRSVISKFHPVETSRGLLLAETLFDSQWFRYIEKAYHNPVPGSIYYTGIGVSVTWFLGDRNSAYRTTENITMWNYMIDNALVEKEDDICWAKSRISYSTCLSKFSLKELRSFYKNYISGMKSYGVNYGRLVLKTFNLAFKSLV